MEFAKSITIFNTTPVMRGLYVYIALILFFYSCKNKTTEPNPSGTIAELNPKTEVTVAYPTDTVRLNNLITLNATASYLLKSDVKANATGYITHTQIKLGDKILKGAVIFGLQTKEARALGNTINTLDPSFRFNGNTTVRSPATGYVAMLNHQIGDYVQDGEILATITDASSFGFVVDVPYEYLEMIKRKATLPITLPDGQTLAGKIARIMPTVDPVSQTIKVLLQVSNPETIPENLIGNVSISKTSVFGLTVPKNAVLSDETQSSFWVMKLINDSVVVKTAIEKGLETNQFIQIKSGNLNKNDRVVVSGNFGLEDRAIVKIQK